MRHRVLFLSLACAAALAACQTSTTVPQPFVANAERSDRGGTTQAWGYVYSDPESKPLANVPVEIAAWEPIRGKLQPSHQVARTNAAGRFVFTAPDGKYLLTIGSDEAYTPPPGYQTPDPLTSVGDDPGLPNMHWLATVHDTIVLSGGSAQVKASVLPKQAYAGEAGGPYKYVRVPAIERSENYRITELSRIEAECLAAEQIRRHLLHRSALVPDEWLMENTRAMHKAQVIDNAVWDGFAWAAIGAPATNPQSSTAGGSTCAFIVLGQNVKPQENIKGTLWFGASEGLSKTDKRTGKRELLQIEEWFPDPRRSSQLWPSPVGRAPIML
jgi:hypothetical protein